MGEGLPLIVTRETAVKKIIRQFPSISAQARMPFLDLLKIHP